MGFKRVLRSAGGEESSRVADVWAINKSTLGLGGAALLAAAIFTGLLWAFRPAAVWDWLITLAATFISLIFAVALFWYQEDK